MAQSTPIISSFFSFGGSTPPCTGSTTKPVVTPKGTLHLQLPVKQRQGVKMLYLYTHTPPDIFLTYSRTRKLLLGEIALHGSPGISLLTLPGYLCRKKLLKDGAMFSFRTQRRLTTAIKQAAPFLIPNPGAQVPGAVRSS